MSKKQTPFIQHKPTPALSSGGPYQNVAAEKKFENTMRLLTDDHDNAAEPCGALRVPVVILRLAQQQHYLYFPSLSRYTVFDRSHNLDRAIRLIAHDGWRNNFVFKYIPKTFLILTPYISAGNSPFFTSMAPGHIGDHLLHNHVRNDSCSEINYVQRSKKLLSSKVFDR